MMRLGEFLERRRVEFCTPEEEREALMVRGLAWRRLAMILNPPWVVRNEPLARPGETFPNPND